MKREGLNAAYSLPAISITIITISLHGTPFARHWMRGILRKATPQKCEPLRTWPPPLNCFTQSVPTRIDRKQDGDRQPAQHHLQEVTMVTLMVMIILITKLFSHTQLSNTYYNQNVGDQWLRCLCQMQPASRWSRRYLSRLSPDHRQLKKLPLQCCGSHHS